MAGKSFDVVVVGSGAAGGWAAKKLTEAGLTVALLEAGRELIPDKHYTEHTLPFQAEHRGVFTPRPLRQRQPVQRTSYAYSPYNSGFFVDDLKNPYTTSKDQPFEWIRARQTGGRTTTWGRVCLRLGDLDLHAASLDGFGVDWPISYFELAPYYDEVERFIGVNGTAMALPQLPDGRFQPGMSLSCGERLFQKVAREQFGRALQIAPSAVLTQELPGGRAACHSCGPCERGCITKSFFSSVHSTLPAAAATGRLTLMHNTIVRELELGKDGRVRAVHCVDASTRRERVVTGRVVALCASTLESTRILLCSRSSTFPTGLGDASGVLGRYLMDHVYVRLGVRHLPQLSGVRDADGKRPTPFIIPRFRNVGRREKPFLRGYMFQGASHDTGRLGHVYANPSVGVGLKEALQSPRPEWWILLVGFGECLPYKENRILLDPEVRDAWGIPAVRVEMQYRENEREMAADMIETGSEMLDALGALGERPKLCLIPGHSVHEVGTARMGNDRATSFLNRWNQSHEVPNLFVLDGAAFPASPCQNPTLTIMALAARASDYIVAEMRRRQL